MAAGQGRFHYRFIDAWAKLPLWWKFGNASDVATDSQGRIFVLDRGIHPILVFDRDGAFITAWGEGLFRYPHGLYIDNQDFVYVADSFAHLVWKFTLDGQLVRTWGNKDTPSPTYNGLPFNQPTGVSVGPSGCMYVSDGYGNLKVQKFAPDGTFLKSWGKPGSGPGEFAILHNLDVDKDERVYVCDRENRRVQIFDGEGKYLTEWRDLSLPGDIRVKDELVYVVEEGNVGDWAGLGAEYSPGVAILSRDGQILARWKEGELGTKGLLNAHGITVDAKGDIYIAQVESATKVFKFASV